MKFWKINNEQNQYLLASEKAIRITNQESAEELQNLINEKKIIDLPVFLLEEIKEFIFIDTDSFVEIHFKDSDKDEIELNVDESVYNELKTFFTRNVKGSEVKNYSMLKQIKAPAIASLIVGGLTGLLYTTAVSLQNGESVRTSGRRGFIKKIIVWIADFLGPTGSLIVGGLLTAFFLFGLVSTIIKPKQGKVIKIKKFPKITF